MGLWKGWIFPRPLWYVRAKTRCQVTFHLSTTSKNYHQHRCSLMIIQKVALANLGISLEVHFSMFYHFYHGLLYCSMDRHGCPDGWGRFCGRMRTIVAPVKRNIIWILSIFDLGWASWFYNGILKETLGKMKNFGWWWRPKFQPFKSMIWIPAYFIVKLLKSPGYLISEVLQP